MTLFKKYGDEEGLYEMDTTGMPYGPEELEVYDNSLPDTFGDKFQEEAAARFIRICQRAGSWCGVGFPLIYDSLHQEWEIHYLEHRNQIMAQKLNKTRRELHKSKVSIYRLLAIVTLGVYTLFVKKPKEPEVLPTSREPVLYSHVFVLGPGQVMKGFIDLCDRGALRSDHSRGFTVYFPTPVLLEPLERYKRWPT